MLARCSLLASPHDGWRAAAGFVAGLAILTRANGMILLLAARALHVGAATVARPAGGAGRGRAADGRAVDDPQRGRAARVRPGHDPVRLGAGRVPTTTRLAPTARTRRRGARSAASRPTCRSTKPWHTTPEIVIERRLRARLARLHPRAPGLRRDRRLLEHAPAARPRVLALVAPHGVDDQRRAASGPTVASSASGSWASLALVGVLRRRSVPWWVWAVPLVMYVSVVFTAAETPRYRAPIDPFLILLAALALTPRFVRSRPEHAQTSWADGRPPAAPARAGAGAGPPTPPRRASSDLYRRLDSIYTALDQFSPAAWQRLRCPSRSSARSPSCPVRPTPAGSPAASPSL